MNHDTQMPLRTVHPSFGFSLLEVLIALVVLSIGLLGTAALQIQGLKNAHSSYQRTLASVMATDAAERLWITFGDGELSNQPLADDVRGSWYPHWSNADLTLPFNADKTTISFDASSDAYTITITWNERRFADTAAESSFEYVTRLLPPR